MRKLYYYLKFVLQTKGLIGFFVRFAMLVRRFDLSGQKIKRALLTIESLGEKYHYKPAILIPAVVLQRHKKLLNNLKKNHFEFAIHGYSHANYKKFNRDKQVAAIQAAKRIFEAFKIPCAGFRAPYLSWNQYTGEAVASNNLLWESNEAFIWNGYADHITVNRFHENAIKMLYDPHPAEAFPIIPRLRKGVVRIPLGLPDDEMLVDRFGISQPSLIQTIWIDSLRKAYAKGDIFVLHLHPERFGLCGDAMEALLNYSLSVTPPIWITSMNEVAEWWIEKSTFTATFRKESDAGYILQCDCSDRAAIVGLNLPGKHASEPFFNNYYLIKDRIFFIASGAVKPCIGVHPHCDKALSAFLKDEGFLHEESSDESEYALFLKGYTTFKPADEMTLLRKIEATHRPIVRYWLWPRRHMSALVTTHDVDSVSLLDFILRPFENTGWINEFN